MEDAPSSVEDVLDEISGMLPHCMHPESEKIDEQTVAWFDQANLVENFEGRDRKLRSARFGLGTSAAFPAVDSPAVLFWACLSLWYTAFDDCYAEQHAAADLPGYFQRAGHLWLMLDETLPPPTFGGPFPHALRELMVTLETVAPHPVPTRVRQALRDYLFIAAWEASLRTSKTPPSEINYLSLDRYAGFYILNLEFVEASPGALLSNDTRRDQRIQRIRTAACDMASCTNQICSGPAEQQEGRFFNPDARHGMANFAQQCLDRARTVASIRDSTAGDPRLGPYCAAVADWAAGTFWWYRMARSTRYRIE
jgi:hypothetical protein